jgi:hypothetical protein
MRPYPLPKDITREEFNGLVTDLYQLLAAKGFDPAAHLVVGDFNDSVHGKARPRFALLPFLHRHRDSSGNDRVKRRAGARPSLADSRTSLALSRRIQLP